MEQAKEKNSTSLVLKNRSSLFVSGVTDIISSDENAISLDTNDGALIVEGNEMHIISMNVSNGEITVEGNIDALAYHDKTQTQKTGFFTRIFK
ncbi:MAG: YabP/YqfC family sporulation protein [Eubacteriales bacterium]